MGALVLGSRPGHAHVGPREAVAGLVAAERRSHDVRAHREHGVCWGANWDGEADAPAGRYTAISAGSIVRRRPAPVARPRGRRDRLLGRRVADRPRTGGPLRGDHDERRRHCALTDDGELVCWMTTASSTRRRDRYRAVDANWLQTCALTLAGEACAGADTTTILEADYSSVEWREVHRPCSDPVPEYACGLSEAGEAGVLGVPVRPVTKQPAPLPAATGRSVTAGSTPARSRSDREAVCWGWPIGGQTEPPPGPFATINSGRHHVCALTLAGEAVCWGDN